MSPAASTARPLVARTLCLTSRSMPLIPIALSNPPIVVGIRQTRSETSTGRLTLTAFFLAGGAFAVVGESRKRKHRENEKRGQANEQNAERNFIRRFLTARAFHHGDHAIDEGVPRFAGDADNDAIA